MYKLLIAVTLLIIYGSLYPFNFSLDSYDSSMLDALSYFGVGQVGRGDFVANVALFIPFGFLAMQSFAGAARWKAWIVTLCIGFAIAHGIQALQMFIPGRVPSGSDSLLNVIGCALGCLLGALRAPGNAASPAVSPAPLPIPTLLAVFLILWNLRPFIPSIDLQLIIDNVKHVLSDPMPDPLWTLQGIATWLIVFHFLKNGGVRLIPEKFFVLLILGTLALSFFIVGNSVTIDRIAGGLIAIPAWALFRRLRPAQRSVVLFYLTLLVVVGISFSPFELRQEPREFSWVPFSGALGGNLFINVLASTKKMLLYGCLIYLLVESGYRLITATLLISSILFVSEYLQVFFRSSTPEVTDSLLALMIGAAFYLWDEQRRKSGTVAAQSPGSAGGSRPKPNSESSPPPGSWHTIHPEQVIPSRYIPGMDGLRAIAALAVFFVHFNQQVGLDALLGPFDLDRFLANGNTGVALFFTLSGLLLSIPFWQAKLSSGEFPNVKSYAIRRAARILPAYYLCLFSILFAMEVVGSGSTWENIFSHVFFVFNTSDRNILSYNQPFWTLAVEVQFYILLPLLFLALSRARAVSTFWLILCLVPLLYSANYLLVETLRANAHWPIDQSLIWPLGVYIKGPESAVLTYSTLAHLPHFLIGVLGARIFLALSETRPRANGLSRSLEIVFWMATLCVFLVLSTPLDDLLQIPLGRYNFPFVPLLLAAIVVCLPFTRYARHILELAWVCWLGRISYGIYIFHYPVQKLVSRGMSMVDLRVTENIWLFGVSSLVVTLLLAYFSYIWLETPVMRWVRRRLDSSRSVSNEDVDSSSGPDGTSAISVLRHSNAKDLLGGDVHTVQDCEEHASQEDGGTTHVLKVNLHESQNAFLHSVQERANLEPGEVCRRLVSHALSATAVTKSDSLYLEFARAGVTVSPVRSKSGRWRQCSIELDSELFAGLGSLAAGQSVSRSRIMRHLLADFMKLFEKNNGRSSRYYAVLIRWLNSKRWIFRNPRLRMLAAATAILAIASLFVFFGPRQDAAGLSGPSWAAARPV